MLSNISAVIECPWCGKSLGYYMSRQGTIYSGETIGRTGKNSLKCVHCNKDIELEIRFRYDKKTK